MSEPFDPGYLEWQKRMKEEGFQVVSIKVDFMCVGFRGDVVADGRIEGHMEGVQLEVVLFSDVFLIYCPW